MENQAARRWAVSPVSFTGERTEPRGTGAGAAGRLGSEGSMASPAQTARNFLWFHLSAQTMSQEKLSSRN